MAGDSGKPYKQLHNLDLYLVQSESNKLPHETEKSVAVLK